MEKTAEQATYRPEVDGSWWKIAGNPDLGEYTSKKQEPVDFAIWQAEDGTWQLWSCIRGTKIGGNSRLFYRWEGDSLTDRDWEPKGIAMIAKPEFGEKKGGLQAPHVVKYNEIYYMFYGDWKRICLATSKDGKEFSRYANEEGEPALFSGPFDQTRDPMVRKENGLYFCYYTDHMIDPSKADEQYPNGIFCRVSTDLVNWSKPVRVSAGGNAAVKDKWWGGDAECPHVVKYNGLYYLFRNQRYGENLLNTQYRSSNPFLFGVGTDRYEIGTLNVAAPEIVIHNDTYYIASLLPTLDGIRLARLKWVKEQ